MTRGKPRDPSKERLWRQHLARWQASQLSIRAYCRREELSEAAFHFWRRTLQQRDRRAAATAPTTAPPQATPAVFLPLTVQPESGTATPWCEIVLANGRCLRLFAPPPLERLAALLTTLEGTPG
jgi:transposase-like protein